MAARANRVCCDIACHHERGECGVAGNGLAPLGLQIRVSCDECAERQVLRVIRVVEQLCAEAWLLLRVLLFPSSELCLGHRGCRSVYTHTPLGRSCTPKGLPGGPLIRNSSRRDLQNAENHDQTLLQGPQDLKMQRHATKAALSCGTRNVGTPPRAARPLASPAAPASAADPMHSPKLPPC
jgi:hypothetical protein